MNPYLANVLPFTPLILHRVLLVLPADRLDVASYEGRFTVREAIAHLADWEPILLARMQQTLEKSGSEIIGMDEGEMAIAHRYDQLDPAAQLRSFATSRVATVQFLLNVPQGGWDTYAIHNERGRQTLYDQANLLLGHDLYHIEQITKMLD